MARLPKLSKALTLSMIQQLSRLTEKSDSTTQQT